MYVVSFANNHTHKKRKEKKNLPKYNEKFMNLVQNINILSRIKVYKCTAFFFNQNSLNID